MSVPTSQRSVFANLVMAPYSQIPAHVQLKDRIKFARACQELRPGDVLPSIRELARALNVGDGVVRRAYRELCEMGLLATEHRKHVVATSRLAPAPDADGAQASVSQCDQLIAWADEHRLSAVALGRLLLRRAIERESASPSYLFVDICRRAAERSVAKISKAWGIKVAGVSVVDFTRNWTGDATHLSAVLVNEYLHEDVLKVAGDIAQRIFSITVRLDERLRRRISRLPRKPCLGHPVSRDQAHDHRRSRVQRARSAIARGGPHRGGRAALKPLGSRHHRQETLRTRPWRAAKLRSQLRGRKSGRA